MSAYATAKRVLRTALAVALVVLVAVFVIQAVPGLVGAESSYVVLSNSMSPQIEPGDSVVVGDVSPETIEAGDVITFEREADQPPVTHRVQEVIHGEEGLQFRTVGDNNEDADPGTVPADAVIGEVWFTIPLVGHVVQFANQPAGAAVVIGVPIALLVLSELWSSGGETTVTRAASNGHSDSDAPVIPQFEGDAEVTGIDPEPGESELTIGATELRLGALGFGTFAMYAIYVALGTTNGVTVGVAVGATIAALFHLGGLAMFVLAGRSDGETPTDPERPREGSDGRGGSAND